jgi:H+/Cl- antiporter ClcA
MPGAMEVTQEPDSGPRPVREQGSLLILALLAFAVGGASGLVGAAFRLVLERSDRLRGTIIDWAHGKESAGLALVIGISAIATGLAAWLVRRLAPGAKGSGLATAFGAPVAGAVFVLEELVRRFDAGITVTTLCASGSAIAVARLLLVTSCGFVPISGLKTFISIT